MNTRPLYFDYAATTPVDERVIQVMIECLGFHGNFGNPASSSHAFGQQARLSVEQARRPRFGASGRGRPGLCKALLDQDRDQHHAQGDRRHGKPEPEEPEQVELVKAKAKRTTKKNNIVIEDVKPVEDPSAPVDIEDIKQVEKPKTIKTLELVQCDKCNKQMTKNTLRYHHEKSCPGKPIDTQALPVKRRTKKEEPTEANKEDKSEVNKQPTYRDKLNERI